MIVVYYGVNLSLSLPFCLSVSLSLFFFPPSSSSGLAIFLHLELSLFCLFSLPRPSVNLARTPSLSYLSFPSGLSISPLLLLLLLLRAILLCSRCSARRKYSLFAPPLDMAKEAICALLAILGHFFGAFSPLDLFFALAPFRPASSAFPRFPPSRLSSLSASAHPVSSSIPTYSISRPSAQVNIIPAWFPSLSETPARAVFIFRASVALDFCHSSGPPAVTSSPVFATARCHCPRLSTLAISCSRAPAAIVPSQEPESRDAGVSRNAGIGSHLAATGFSNGQEAVL